MNTIIVYYSLEGNTDYTAAKAADLLGAETLRLITKKAYPDKGFKKFLWGGKSVIMGEKPELEPYEFDPAAYDLVIFGFPIWASNMAPPIRTFLRDNDLSGKKIAVFACQAGTGAEKAFAKLKEALQIEAFEAELILIDPKNRENEENEKKIKEFCEKLQNR